MTRGTDLAAISRPTILEIWAPTCVKFKAMQPDLDVMAKTFFGRVDLKMVSAAEELEMVRRLGVRPLPL